MDIDARYARVLDRRSPAVDRRVGLIKETSSDIAGKYIQYVVAAMSPVASQYTQRLIQQGNRIQATLSGYSALTVYQLLYRRQGSVSNNTHIRFHSDVDVLVITDNFYWVDKPLTITSPYGGDWTQDFENIRSHCKKCLEINFPAAKVDDSGHISLKISEGTLECLVDVVPAAWVDTERWRQTNDETYRGVGVYNRSTKDKVKNYPFLNNSLLKIKDEKFQNSPKALIRFIKTVMADISTERGYKWDLSSYDVCSIVYHMADHLFATPFRPFTLLSGLVECLAYINTNKAVIDSLVVIDESRLIFDKEAKKFDLIVLIADLRLMIANIQADTGSDLITHLHLV